MSVHVFTLKGVNRVRKTFRVVQWLAGLIRPPCLTLKVVDPVKPGLNPIGLVSFWVSFALVITRDILIFRIESRLKVAFLGFGSACLAANNPNRRLIRVLVQRTQSLLGFPLEPKRIGATNSRLKPVEQVLSGYQAFCYPLNGAG